MKKIIYSLLVLMSLLTFSSCGETSDDLSVVTYFATLQLEGETLLTIPVGESYTEPGYVATEGDADITDRVVVSGTVDTDVPGYYVLTYSVANMDGFSVSQTRRVLVVDSNNFASAYLAESQFGSRHYTDAPVVITQNADGTYTIDDILGGFYWNGRYPGYEDAGYDFHVDSNLSLNDDNSITLNSTGSWYFATGAADDAVITLTSGNYNPLTGTVVLALAMDGEPFSVVLTK